MFENYSGFIKDLRDGGFAHKRKRHAPAYVCEAFDKGRTYNTEFGRIVEGLDVRIHNDSDGSIAKLPDPELDDSSVGV